MQRSRAVSVARDVVAVARERQVTVTAAGLAYHAFNTLVPLAILAIVGMSFVDELDGVFRTLEFATGLEAANVQGALDDAVGEASGRGRAAVLAVVIFSWSAFRAFRAVNDAFADVYGERKRGTVLGTVVDVALVVATLSVSIVLVAAVGVTLSFTMDGPAWTLLSPLLLVALLLVVFLPMYYVFPHPSVSVREVLPGTVFAAVTWTISAMGFRVYALTADSVELFGVAGAVLLLLTWMYVGGLLVLLGATINAVLADRVEPEHGWVPLRETVERVA